MVRCMYLLLAPYLLAFGYADFALFFIRTVCNNSAFLSLYKLFAEVTQLFLIFYSIEFLSANKLCQL